jgi:hypothetical protein
MTNPWLKKNPWLSMWMSGANAVLGSARGRATAEARRQAATVTNQAISEAVRFWTGAMTLPRKKSSRKKSSR